RELLCRLSEIAARGEFDAPRVATEINGIEIELENLILAQRVFHARRNNHLPDLALVGEIFANQQVFHDLLGDGRAALGPARLSEIADEGADQTITDRKSTRLNS